jgi:hypothetical protein
MKYQSITRGKGAKDWGAYEWKRLWGTAWPILLGLVSTLAVQLATDLSTEVSAPVGMLIGLAAKAFSQWVTDNSGRTL